MYEAFASSSPPRRAWTISRALSRFSFDTSERLSTNGGEELVAAPEELKVCSVKDEDSRTGAAVFEEEPPPLAGAIAPS